MNINSNRQSRQTTRQQGKES